MKAIVLSRYGSPDVLQLKEVEKPTPGDDEVLIKVHAAAANPLDWHRMRGAPFLVRLGEGFRKPKDSRIGVDLAGRVEAVGKNVTEFQPGDAVFGSRNGAFAEYVCAPEKALVSKPDNISFEGAASVPVVAFTALQGLRKGNIQAGQKVLVNGASGGVGSFAVQLAKHFGTEVTGVCSTSKIDMVRSIGADHVIDYTQEDFTRNGQRYDLIYDAVGNRSARDMARALKPGGVCMIAGFTGIFHMITQSMLMGAIISKLGSKTIGGMGIAQTDKADLQFVRDLLEAGKITPVIDRCYPLDETAEAIRYLEQGHARGKVIVSIEQNSKI